MEDADSDSYIVTDLSNSIHSRFCYHFNMITTRCMLIYFAEFNWHDFCNVEK